MTREGSRSLLTPHCSSYEKRSEAGDEGSRAAGACSGAALPFGQKNATYIWHLRCYEKRSPKIHYWQRRRQGDGPRREEARAEQAAGRLEGPADVHRGRCAGAAVLVQEREIGRDRAQERKENSKVETHRGRCRRREPGARGTSAATVLMPLCSRSNADRCSINLAHLPGARRVTDVTRKCLQIHQNRSSWWMSTG